MDNIISMVKDKVASVIGSDTDIPQDKKEETVKTATTSIIDGLKSSIKPDNISSFTSLLGMGGSGTQDTGQVKDNEITRGVESNVVSSLTSKVGLNQGSATMIAALLVPAVIALFAHKAKNSNGSGFDVGSLVKAFTGNGNSSSGGNIMEKVGSFFGK